MSEPILTRDQILKIVRKTLKENNDRDKLSADTFVKLVAALEEVWMEEVCGEPVAVIDSAFQLLYCRENWSEGLKVGTPLYALTRSKP
ncbi:hypothetical protein [Burkholderia lata]|uniref:Uncharacterized protein n=1 Tax=Burkholderia lata (strain ATCC 17760 / DSM 23089 / LMG 22485 / NCIMB 9086 / R18194 / 383) TaxID=482957 RepID=A0A6P2GVB9_BURL3|nr:hypothetical protein [Burkholderia lata]VWB08473.1 hypothetical protein BLA6863_00219 [Burkholderia lata]